MTEEDLVRSDLEKAKTIMGKVDPVLLSTALSEMMMEAGKAEEADDVARVKKAIKGVYDSIPEGKDKASIMSKAIAEFDADVVDKEIAIIKEKLAGIALETLMDAATNYVGEKGIVISPCKTYLRPQGIPWGNIDACRIFGVQPKLPEWTRCKEPIYEEECLFRLEPCVRCLFYALPEYRIPYDWLEELKGEIIQDMLQRPEFPRAIKNMLKEIKGEK